MSGEHDPGYFYGAGIGFGVFGSVFACAGFWLFIGSWIECCKYTEWVCTNLYILIL